MLRGLAHASLLFTAALVPGGARAYHALTRGLLGSQTRVLRKLQRVWPGYAAAAVRAVLEAGFALDDAGAPARRGHPLLFHNRLCPSEVLALFEAAGFERIAVRRFILPDKRYVDADAAAAGEPGVPAWLQSGRLRRLSTEDRHTAAIHYLFKKPGRS